MSCYPVAQEIIFGPADFVVVRAIARSIDAFGFNAPILVDKHNQIVAGHGRSKSWWESVRSCWQLLVLDWQSSFSGPT